MAISVVSHLSWLLSFDMCVLMEVGVVINVHVLSRESTPEYSELALAPELLLSLDTVTQAVSPHELQTNQDTLQYDCYHHELAHAL